MTNWLAGMNEDIKVKRGQHHEYLGMNLNYSRVGKVQISMASYMKIIEVFPERIEMSTMLGLK